MNAGKTVLTFFIAVLGIIIAFYGCESVPNIDVASHSVRLTVAPNLTDVQVSIELTFGARKYPVSSLAYRIAVETISGLKASSGSGALVRADVRPGASTVLVFRFRPVKKGLFTLSATFTVEKAVDDLHGKYRIRLVNLFDPEVEAAKTELSVILPGDGFSFLNGIEARTESVSSENGNLSFHFKAENWKSTYPSVEFAVK